MLQLIDVTVGIAIYSCIYSSTQSSVRAMTAGLPIYSSILYTLVSTDCIQGGVLQLIDVTVGMAYVLV